MVDTKCIHLTAEMAQQCLTCNPYPYTHHGPSVHGSKLKDFLISEASMIEAGILPDPMKMEPLGDEFTEAIFDDLDSLYETEKGPK